MCTESTGLHGAYLMVTSKLGGQSDGFFSEEHVHDIDLFGVLMTRLTQLSKYADTVAESILQEGFSPEAAKPFMAKTVTYYAQLRAELTGQFRDDTRRDAALAAMHDLVEDDAVASALVLDQAVAYLAATVETGTFKHRLEVLQHQQGSREMNGPGSNGNYL